MTACFSRVDGLSTDPRVGASIFFLTFIHDYIHNFSTIFLQTLEFGTFYSPNVLTSTRVWDLPFTHPHLPFERLSQDSMTLCYFTSFKNIL